MFHACVCVARSAVALWEMKGKITSHRTLQSMPAPIVCIAQASCRNDKARRVKDGGGGGGVTNTNTILRWLGTVLGRTECANFFVKTYCLWHTHLENEIILGGHHARFFRKWSTWENGDLLA